MTTITRSDDPTAPPRSRRRVRRTATVALALACAATLVACTPSGYEAEEAAVITIHRIETGQNVAMSEVSCNEFTRVSEGRFDGLCRVRAEVWAVSSQYAQGHEAAWVSVGKWDGSMGGECMLRKRSYGWEIQYC